MPLTGDVELKQNGVVVSARDLTVTSKPMDVAINDAAGNQLSGFDASRPATSALTQPAVTNVSSVILPANVARRKFTIFSDASKKVYIAFGGTASTSAFTMTIPAGGFFESQNDSYTGDLSAVVTGPGITIQVTEITT